MPYVLDTGVLLRLFDRNDPSHVTIRQAVIRLKIRGERLVTTAQNIAEFWNVSTRPPTARGGYGLPVERVETRVAFIERFCGLLFNDASSYAQWKLLVTNHRIIGVSVHDARIAAMMVRHGLSHLVTLNVDDFRRFSGIVPMTPEEVLASLKAP
jgi:predicted nucleic acid-binding protein